MIALRLFSSDSAHGQPFPPSGKSFPVRNTVLAVNSAFSSHLLWYAGCITVLTPDASCSVLSLRKVALATGEASSATCQALLALSESRATELHCKLESAAEGRQLGTGAPITNCSTGRLRSANWKWDLEEQSMKRLIMTMMTLALLTSLCAAQRGQAPMSTNRGMTQVGRGDLAPFGTTSRVGQPNIVRPNAVPMAPVPNRPATATVPGTGTSHSAAGVTTMPNTAVKPNAVGNPQSVPPDAIPRANPRLEN